MNVRFQKWGNSIAVRIPARALKELGLAEGSSASLSIESGSIVLEPVPAKRRYSLQDLVSGITQDNMYEEVDFGPPVGAEIW